MDGIIDLVIAVLFVAVPVIFKAIGNKLEKSGKADKARKFKKISDVFEDDDKEESTLEGWLLGKMEPEEADEIPALDSAPEVVMKPDAPVFMKPAVVQPVENVVSQVKTTKRPETIRPTSRKPMMLIEDEPKKQGEKIDPKKLVIYSEIMKRKF